MQRYRIVGMLAAAVLSTGLISATSAQAAGRAITVSGKASASAGVRSETIAHSDLDLRNASDLRALETRVKQAIQRVCAGAADKACEKRSWRAASMQIDRAVPVLN